MQVDKLVCKDNSRLGGDSVEPSVFVLWFQRNVPPLWSR